MSGSTLLGGGLLALYGSPETTDKAGFNEWYTHEHLAERMAIPGFLRARRYVADLPGPAPVWDYFTIYETQSLDTLNSPEYLTVLDSPTPGTSRYIPLFAEMHRTACEVVHTVGRAEGGNMSFVEFGPRPGTEDELRRFVVEEFAPEAVRRPSVVGVHLAVADATASDTSGTDLYQGISATPGRWLLMVEGAWVDLDAARAQLDADVEALRAHGAQESGHQLFRLLAQLGRA